MDGVTAPNAMPPTHVMIDPEATVNALRNENTILTQEIKTQSALEKSVSSRGMRSLQEQGDWWVMVTCCLAGFVSYEGWSGEWPRSCGDTEDVGPAKYASRY